MDYAILNAWDVKGTSPEKHEEAVEARRQFLKENPGHAEKQLAEYQKWYREERVPTWQERLVNKVKGKGKEKEKDEQKDEDHESIRVGSAEKPSG